MVTIKNVSCKKDEESIKEAKERKMRHTGRNNNKDDNVL